MINSARQRINHIIQQQAFDITLRVFAAIIGGYVLSNLLAVLLSYLLPMLFARSPADGVMIAILSSYLIYALIVMWVFYGKTLLQVWRTLTITFVTCAFLVYIFIPEGLF